MLKLHVSGLNAVYDDFFNLQKKKGKRTGIMPVSNGIILLQKKNDTN